MEFRFVHNCLFVLDLQRSLDFYKKALGLEPVRWMKPSDQNATLAFLSDGRSVHQLELACVAGRTEPYDVGEAAYHIAFAVRDVDAAKALHAAMGCISRDPETEPVYFIKDPDGYEIEIIPEEEDA